MAVTRVIIEKNVAIPLRDGVMTYGDLYRPESGTPVPALVTRTPYDKEQQWGSAVFAVLPSPVKLAERDYAVVVADVRGRYSSEGTFHPWVNEEADGYDTIEWIASQPWCDGNVGIYGLSYIGATTLLAARGRPPSLRCAIAIVTADDYFNGWTYQGGAFELGFMTHWAQDLAATHLLRKDHGVAPADGPALERAISAGLATYQSRPLVEMPGLSAPNLAPYWRQWLEHDHDDDYWAPISIARKHSDIDLPILHVGGWFDIFTKGTVRNFQGLHAAGRQPQHLWMGPWSHREYDQHLGELNFGPAGSAQFCGIIREYNRFLDRYLRGRESTSPSVHYFLMGANAWRDADRWPPPEARPVVYHLHSRGRANSVRGEGALHPDPPGGEPVDRYLYDPDHPVPTEGGAALHTRVGLPGPRDQRTLEQRDDVLCYTIDPLRAPLTVAGPVTVDLWAVTDAPDTDWTAKLVDVWPDGRAVSLCDGIMRARFRESLSAPHPVPPGVPTRYTIDLGSTAYRFAAGHRVRVEISSSNFPKFDPNPNTGRTLAADRVSRPAIQQVLHDAQYPSHLQLWALPD